jgi:hypothetical protein
VDELVGAGSACAAADERALGGELLGLMLDAVVMVR